MWRKPQTLTLPSSHDISVLENNQVIYTTSYEILSSEQTLPRHMHIQNWHNSKQQITTLAKLPTYSEPRNLHDTMFVTHTRH